MKKTFKKVLSILLITILTLAVCTTFIACNGGNENGGDNGGDNNGNGGDNNGNGGTTETKVKVYLKGIAVYDDFSKVALNEIKINYDGIEVGRLSEDGAMTGNVFHEVATSVTYDNFISKLSLDVDSYYNYYISTGENTSFSTIDGKTVAEFDILLREASKGNIATDIISIPPHSAIGVINGGDQKLSGVKIFAVGDNGTENLITTSNANGFEIKFITVGTKVKFEAPDGYVFAGIRIGNNANMSPASEFPGGILTISTEHSNGLRVFMKAAQA